jgi:hypothetical protein
MTRKVYKTAMGKPVDMGALQLQNENVRAVGNMGVNARGDVVDSGNKVIDQKNRQVQRQYRRSTNVSTQHVETSNVAVRKARQETEIQEISDITSQTPSMTEVVDVSLPTGGLAAAIAKARSVQQTLETPLSSNHTTKTGVKKI